MSWELRNLKMSRVTESHNQGIVLKFKQVKNFEMLLSGIVPTYIIYCNVILYCLYLMKTNF